MLSEDLCRTIVATIERGSMPRAHAASLFDVRPLLVKRYLMIARKRVPSRLGKAPDDLRRLTRTPGPFSKKM
jgi:hypothetical protein